MSFTKYMRIFIATIMIIVGIMGVPSAVLEGGVHKLVMYTFLLFAGLWMLGKANK